MDKTERLLKRLKNIEDKNKEQFDEIECQKNLLEITGKHRKIIVYLKNPKTNCLKSILILSLIMVGIY